MAKPLGDSVVVEQPRVEYKEIQYTIGYRKWIPSKTIGSAVTHFHSLTEKYLASLAIAVSGRPFFRLHCINMGIEFDLEAGFLCASPLQGDGLIIANTLRAGRYATLKYAGKNRGYQGNKALIEWARANNLEMDHWDAARGDTFACRYELYLTDIAAEPDNKKWIKEVAIRLKD